MSSADLVREQRLRVTKRQATALLGAVSVAWLAITIFGGGAAWVGYVKATLEASMVGGLADWFAVTALFRRPLGLPIPHTAIVAERKDQFGATLGSFFDSFLTPEAIEERLRAARVAERAAAWLAVPSNAARVAGHVADAFVTAIDFVDDEEIHDVMVNLVRSRVDDVQVAPLAGRALRWAAAEGRDKEIVDALLRGFDRYLDTHGPSLRARLGERTPWWLPGFAEERLLERLVVAVRATVASMVGNPAHPLRKDLSASIARLADELSTSPLLAARGEELKHDLLARPELRKWAATTWSSLKEELRTSAALRERVASTLVAAASRVEGDPALRASIADGVSRVAGWAVGRFSGEISGLVSATIARWDASETSRRLELLLGPDLQYIRINGTVVGAGAGLVLYSLSRVIG